MGYWFGVWGLGNGLTERRLRIRGILGVVVGLGVFGLKVVEVKWFGRVWAVAVGLT